MNKKWNSLSVYVRRNRGDTLTDMSETTSHCQETGQRVPRLEFESFQNIEHARNCSCRPLGGKILEEVKKRYMNTHQEFWIFFNRNDHKTLALWAADCAGHVLPFFEEKYPEDSRPRKAIEKCREWARTGEFKMADIRKASLDSHALGAPIYAIKAVAAINPADAKVAIANERDWQFRRLPENLRKWVDSGVKQKQRLIPKNLRSVSCISI